MDATYFTKAVGESFYRIRMHGYFFVDNSEVIRAFEASSSHTLLCRPRRFGKSLLLNMLRCYYDQRLSVHFERLFRGDVAQGRKALSIGVTPTGKQSTYKVLYVDLSGLDEGGGVSEIRVAFKAKVKSALESFRVQYQLGFAVDDDSGVTMCNLADELNRDCDNRLLVLVDEYDRYTNDLLHKVTEQNLEELLKPLERFFQNLKMLGQLLFIADYRSVTVGVLPLAVACFSSWNGFSDLTMSADFADYFGFREEHVRETVTLLESHHPRSDNIVGVMRELLNGYCFFNAKCTLFNPQYVTRFFSNLFNDHFKTTVAEKPFSEWAVDDKEYIVGNGDPTVQPHRFYHFMRHAPACSVELMSAFCSSSYAHLREVNVASMRMKRMCLDRLLSDDEQLRWFMYYQGFLTFDVDTTSKIAWQKAQLPLRLPNAITRQDHFPELMCQLESKYHLLQRLWEDINVENLRALISNILSWLESDTSSGRMTEAGFQACLESTVREMSSQAQKQRLRVKAHFNLDKHECDLLFAQEADVMSNDGDGSYRGKAILIELKRLTATDIIVHTAFVDGKAKVVSNRLVSLSEGELLALKLKDKAKHIYTALDVAGVVNFAKEQVQRQANDLRATPEWSSYKMHLFVAVLTVDRVVVANAG